MCVMMGLVLCGDDSECPNNEKCCSAMCGGRQCVAPVTVKPGVCPNTKYEAAKCAQIRPRSCADDSDCAKREKCCKNGCGINMCMAPVTVKPGVCPNTKYEAAKCAQIRPMSCADDSDCSNDLKCCSNGCGLKPGVCPNTKYEVAKCKKKGEELCADDSECPNKEKCCRTMCNVKPGVCPNTKYEVAKCKKKGEELCADDSECPNKEKCCRSA
ncbi:hypothetical protein PO909_013716 [Leuciscus waleckii]